MRIAIDNKIIIEALKDKRNKLQDEINQLDAYIKQLRNNDISQQSPNVLEQPQNSNILHQSSLEHDSSMSLALNIPFSSLSVKKQIIQIMDAKLMPVKFNDLQSEYATLTNSKYQIRDILRGMNKQGVIRILKINNSNKHAYWVKDEWIDKDKELLKEGFDGGLNSMYSPDEFSFK